MLICAFPAAVTVAPFWSTKTAQETAGVCVGVKFEEYLATPLVIRRSSIRQLIDRLFIWPMENGYVVAESGVPDIAVAVLPTPFTQSRMPADVFVIAMWFHWFAVTVCVELTLLRAPFQ